MTEPNSQTEKPKASPPFSQEQSDMLKRCSDKKDMAEWNEWRKEHPNENIILEAANLSGMHLESVLLNAGGTKNTETGEYDRFGGEVHLENANFRNASLKHANLRGAFLQSAHLARAHLEGADLCCAQLNDAYLNETHLEEALLWDTDLRGAKLSSSHLQRAKVNGAHLEGASLIGANLQESHLENSHFQKAWLCDANLQGAVFHSANLQDANLSLAKLQGADFSRAIVDGNTLIWRCQVDRKTNFRGVGLDGCRIDEGTKYLLQYNQRRLNWQDWYRGESDKKWISKLRQLLTSPVRLFWCISDYGLSTGRIIAVFVGLVVVFSSIYYVCGMIAPPGIVDYLFVDGNGEKVAWWIVPWRAIHFSVVIMTVGFTNMHANAHSFWAHILVGFQMILGFVLLGALVTRFAVLFTAGGPAGKFAEENKQKDERRSD